MQVFVVEITSKIEVHDRRHGETGFASEGFWAVLSKDSDAAIRALFTVEKLADIIKAGALARFTGKTLNAAAVAERALVPQPDVPIFLKNFYKFANLEEIPA